GQMLAYPLTTWIILQSSWPMVFYVNAVFGFVWVIAWLWYATDTPDAHPRVSQEERQYIASNLPPKPIASLPLRAVFTNPSLLILALSYMCFAYVGWMFLFWFPAYLVEGRGFSLGAMGVIGIAVHGAGFVGLIGGGVLSDRLLRAGWSPQFARARFSGIGVALSLPFLLGVVLVPSASACILLLVLFYFLFASAIAGYTTVALEFNPHVAGAIFGLINTLGSLAGIFGPMTAGFLLAQSGDWTLPFVVATAVGAVCAAILFVVPIRPITLDTRAPASVVQKGATH
ncbi:MAG: MFS transporter, partial [Candidatus Binatia bacterium]